jgi:murein DD-endopeptidase MepM/ murein hydrolase activator NlpD
LPGPQVGRRHFDPPAQRWLPGHRGVDLLGATGSPVEAVDHGVVHFSGVVAGTGVVSVRHRDGLLSTYQPVEDRAPRGQVVSRGESLGSLAPGGHCLLLTCLHLGARRGEVYLDPLLLLRRWEVSLLPFRDRG